jgi:hypothetical protein
MMRYRQRQRHVSRESAPGLGARVNETPQRDKQIMFKAKTVMILGAGASWHYGYPTGEELVKRVIAKATTVARYFNDYVNNSQAILQNRPRIVSGDDPTMPKDGNAGLRKQWEAAIKKCQALVERLNAADPLVIDYFIDHNRDLEDIAMLCIAWVILEREFVSDRYRDSGNENRREIAKKDRAQAVVYGEKDNWHRFLLHKMTSGCPDRVTLLGNKVTFVTFNYDVSLDIGLYRGLRHSARFSNYAEKFITENDRIIHVYGQLRKDPPWRVTEIKWETFLSVSLARSVLPQTPPPQLWSDVRAILDHAHEASRGLKIIAPEKALAESDSVPEHIQKARKTIAEAECVYILGYGFDALNNALLELPKYLNRQRYNGSVMFTNYQNSGVINKTVARLFGLDPNDLLPEGGCFKAQQTRCSRKASKTSMARWRWTSILPRKGLAPVSGSTPHGSCVAVEAHQVLLHTVGGTGLRQKTIAELLGYTLEAYRKGSGATESADRSAW